MQALLCLIVFAAPLAWAIWVDKGSITGGMVAWLEIAGPVLVTLAILRVAWVLGRASRDENGHGSHERAR